MDIQSSVPTSPACHVGTLLVLRLLRRLSGASGLLLLTGTLLSPSRIPSRSCC